MMKRKKQLVPPSRIGSACRIAGIVRAPGDLVVSGCIAGAVHVAGELTVDAGGSIAGGPVFCSGAGISGTVECDMTVTGELHVFRGGRVTGNVTARRVVVHPEGEFMVRHSVSYPVS